MTEKAAVLLACLNRHGLLERTIYTLSRQTYPTDVFILDDGSRPGIEKIAADAGVYYERLRPPLINSGGRSPTAPWRYMFKKTDHEFVIVTAQDILVPFDAVERMIDQHESPRRSTPLLYFVNRPLLKHIDDYLWREDVHSLQKAPGFMEIWNRWGYFNRDMNQWKHHVGFTGQLRKDWEEHDFMPEGVMTDAWLWDVEDDLSRKTGVNHYANQIDLTVYHLFHSVSDQSAGGDNLWYLQNYGSLHESPYDDRSVRIRRIAEASKSP